MVWVSPVLCTRFSLVPVRLLGLSPADLWAAVTKPRRVK
jgi:hypothetical protein